ncbi:TIR domain-containing protein [Stieleria magnilauensis]
MFIGSSSEGLEVAEAIQQNLDYHCEVTIWSQGVFGLSRGTLESLVERLDDFDFAALVIRPDDVITVRGETTESPRDNVLLELGLCIGALGRDRTFMVYDRENAPKLPTDLAGVTPATYQMHNNGNVQSSLGAASTLLKEAVQRLGKRTPKIVASIDDETQFQIIHDLLDNAAEQFLIWMLENDAKMVRGHRYLDKGIKYEYFNRDESGGQGGFSIGELCEKLPDAGLLGIDLRDQVSLTERGKQFAQWLVENGHKATYFLSDVGGWGERRGRPSFIIPEGVKSTRRGPNMHGQRQPKREEQESSEDR